MIIKELKTEIVDIITGFFNKELLSIILYGSYAEDRETQYSDIDLLIIIDKEKNESCL